MAATPTRQVWPQYGGGFVGDDNLDRAMDEKKYRSEWGMQEYTEQWKKPWLFRLYGIIVYHYKL